MNIKIRKNKYKNGAGNLLIITCSYGIIVTTNSL